ncbi:MAG: transposase [Bacteroidota bacterium]
MPKSRRPYPADFKKQIIELARSGRSVADLAQEFEPSEQTIYTWLKRTDREEGKRADGLSSKERDELRHLRKENRRLQQERDILAKATAWFARETDVIPPKSSRS